MKKILIITSILIISVYLSSVLNKVDVSWSDININWKLAVDWKICDLDNNCLVECSWEKIWDTGTNTCITPASTPDSAWLSCKDIYDNKWVRTSWTYYIKPTSYTWIPFKVYCDMTVDGWGRTLISAYRISGWAVTTSKVANWILDYDPYDSSKWVVWQNRFIDASTIDATSIRYDCKVDIYDRVVQIWTWGLAVSIKNNPLATRSSTFSSWTWWENNVSTTLAGQETVYSANYSWFWSPFGRYWPDWWIRFDWWNRDSCAVWWQVKWTYQYNKAWYWTMWWNKKKTYA